MKKIIKGKTYNTETAELIGWVKDVFVNNVAMYRRPHKGEYFICDEHDHLIEAYSDFFAETLMHSGHIVFDE